MLNDKTIVGLDVHGTATQAAVLEFATGELTFRRVNGPPNEIIGYLQGLGGRVLATYEAGPMGYGLARAAAELGLDVRVCAPGSILRRPHERIKTDRRDAERLARLLVAGELSFVRVPSVQEESFRDLARCREAARGDLMRARHRLGKLLLRRAVRFPGPESNWTLAHWKWLNQLAFDDAPSRAVLTDYLTAVRALEQRRGALDNIIEETWAESPWAHTIARLRCMRGINSTTAFGLCAEIGDFHRFKHPATLSSYLGIVPSEHSSGEQTRRGPITKAGSPHARRLLVEAAHHYRHTPAIGMALTRRQDGQDPRARVRSRGAPNSACTTNTSGCAPSAASQRTSSRSRSHASWPRSHGRSANSPEHQPTTPLPDGSNGAVGATRETPGPGLSRLAGPRCVLGQPAPCWPRPPPDCAPRDESAVMR